jgi:putative endonuclease
MNLSYHKPKQFYYHYVYILTNKYRTTLYIGVTNNLYRRIQEHLQDIEDSKDTFVARYKTSDLIYTEKFMVITNAISREKELKGWRRDKKLALIKKYNPTMQTIILHQTS